MDKIKAVNYRMFAFLLAMIMVFGIFGQYSGYVRAEETISDPMNTGPPCGCTEDSKENCTILKELAEFVGPFEGEYPKCECEYCIPVGDGDDDSELCDCWVLDGEDEDGNDLYAMICDGGIECTCKCHIIPDGGCDCCEGFDADVDDEGNDVLEKRCKGECCDGEGVCENCGCEKVDDGVVNGTMPINNLLGEFSLMQVNNPLGIPPNDARIVKTIAKTVTPVENDFREYEVEFRFTIQEWYPTGATVRTSAAAGVKSKGYLKASPDADPTKTGPKRHPNSNSSSGFAGGAEKTAMFVFNTAGGALDPNKGYILRGYYTSTGVYVPMPTTFDYTVRPNAYRDKPAEEAYVRLPTNHGKYVNIGTNQYNIWIPGFYLAEINGIVDLNNTLAYEEAQNYIWTIFNSNPNTQFVFDEYLISPPQYKKIDEVTIEDSLPAGFELVGASSNLTVMYRDANDPTYPNNPFTAAPLNTYSLNPNPNPSIAPFDLLITLNDVYSNPNEYKITYKIKVGQTDFPQGQLNYNGLNFAQFIYSTKDSSKGDQLFNPIYVVIPSNTSPLFSSHSMIDIPPLFTLGLAISAYPTNAAHELNTANKYPNLDSDIDWSKISVGTTSTLYPLVYLGDGVNYHQLVDNIENSPFNYMNWFDEYKYNDYAANFAVGISDTKFSIPLTWLAYYTQLVGGTTTTYTQTGTASATFTGTAASHVLNNYGIGDYYFKATATLAGSYCMRNSPIDHPGSDDAEPHPGLFPSSKWCTVHLTVEGGRLIIRSYWKDNTDLFDGYISGTNKGNLHFVDVTVTKPESGTFQIASEIRAEDNGYNDAELAKDKVYFPVSNAKDYIKSKFGVYVPYGYLATVIYAGPAKCASSCTVHTTAADCSKYIGTQYTANDQIIIIEVTTQMLPFYRDCADGPATVYPIAVQQ